MRIIITFLWLIASAALHADMEPGGKETQIRQLEKSLARIQQESQSTYQQFLMIQELRRNELSEAPAYAQPSSPSTSIPIPKYEEFVELRQEKQKRIEKYAADLDRLYSRYRELEDEKRAIMEQIQSLEEKAEE